jgi:hypothetical protein
VGSPGYGRHHRANPIGVDIERDGGVDEIELCQSAHHQEIGAMLDACLSRVSDDSLRPLASQ